ncbi:SemiSWEET family sugar transporter [Candidatus Omnitrophota bacterium]
MHRIHISTIGVIAGVCTSMSFVPQIIKIVKTKHVRDLSLGMYIILTTGIFLWLIYGILIKEFPIILANAAALIMCLFVVVSKIAFREKDQK